MKQTPESDGGRKLTVDGAFDEAMTHFNAGRIDQADKLCTAIMHAAPNHVGAINLLAMIAQKVNRHDLAASLLRRAVAIAPKDPFLHFGLGNAEAELGRLADSRACYRQAIAIKPDFPEAHFNLGNNLWDQGEHGSALEHMRQATTLKKDFYQAHFNLGNMLQSQGEIKAAATSYQNAIAAQADFAPAHCNLGKLMTDLGRLDEAVAHLKKAITINHDYSDALNNLGIATGLQGRSDEAVESYRRAIAAKPDYTEAYCNLAQELRDQNRFDAAIACLYRALAIKPAAAAIHYALGNAHMANNDPEAALAAFEAAYERDPSRADALAEALHIRLHLCLWDGFDARWQKLVNLLHDKPQRISPFLFSSLPASPTEQKKCAADFISLKVARQEPMSATAAHSPTPEKLVIGYLSADFNDHAVAYLVAEILELHDRKRFSIIAYSYGRNDGGNMRQRISAACDRFVDIAVMDHDTAARQIVTDGVHILVDLTGLTKGGRLDILSRHPAPIQINWLGYPGTMGAGFMDYIISDPFITTPELEVNFSEKVARLPHCYQPNDRRRIIALKTPGRRECGLPATGLVFANFNQSYKITPEMFAVWMRLLREVDDAVLWLLESHPKAMKNLRSHAEAAAVDGSRLIFAPKLPLARHLARFRIVDLVVDTFPYTSHTTGSDALWAGCPLVTRSGDTFASRVAGSLLVNVGLAELITNSNEEYASLIMSLARNPQRLTLLRQKLAENLPDSPLLDSPGFCKNLEKLYATMWHSHVTTRLLPENG